MEESSINSNALSEFSSQQVSQLSNHSRSPNLGGQFSQNELFMIEKIYRKASELSHLEAEYSKRLQDSRSPQLHSFSQSISEEYSDILNKKHNFVENLTDAISDVSTSIDIHNYNIHNFQELSALLKNRYDEGKQDTHVVNGQIKKLECESKLLGSLISLYRKLKEDENNPHEQEEHLKIQQMFHEAKTDMETVLKTLYPQERKRNEIGTIMSKLTSAYLNNLGDVEKQFIELQHSVLRNEGLLQLRRAKVILQHTSNPNKFRLSVED